MQDVQTPSFFGVLPTIARTVWMLGFQRRRVRRCEWLTDMPKPGPLPQTSQVAATVILLSGSEACCSHPAPLGNPNTIAAGIASPPKLTSGGGPLLQVLDAA